MVRLLNIYGDTNATKISGYGHDISSQRLDDLDRSALACLLRYEKATFLDLACGHARVGLIASLIAESTILIDSADFSEQVRAFMDVTQAPVRFMQMDARQIQCGFFPPLHIIYSQRFIHYLRYQEALQLISVLFSCSAPGAFLFISASGLGSELGNHYSGSDFPVTHRYSLLEASIAEKHNILCPVCLYTEDEFVGLMKAAGYHEVNVYRSDFGNIKGIFQKVS